MASSRTPVDWNNAGANVQSSKLSAVFRSVALAAIIKRWNNTWTPAAILQSVPSHSKGFLSIEQLQVSFQSRVSLDGDISLFCLPVTCQTPLSSCRVWFISAHLGIARVQMVRCCSVMPLPLVKPPDVLRLLMSTCSIMWMVESPAHCLSDLLATWRPSRKDWYTSGCSSGNIIIVPRCSNIGKHLLCSF